MIVLPYSLYWLARYLLFAFRDEHRRDFPIEVAHGRCIEVALVVTVGHTKALGLRPAFQLQSLVVDQRAPELPAKLPCPS